MKKKSLVIACLLLLSCEGAIKNSDAEVKEPQGAEVEDSTMASQESTENQETETKVELPTEKVDILGYWVGYFEPDKKKIKDFNEMWVDEGFNWNRNNKINISIDRVVGEQVYGHSVVAGNDRPFEGSIKRIAQGNDTLYQIKAKEPGDDQYDGAFEFSIENGQLKGTWTANRNLKIKYRIYELEKKTYQYNPDIMLTHTGPYVNWTKRIDKVETYGEGDEVEEWIYSSYGSATDKIYKVNASNTLLKKGDVENMKKGDLTIIRNTIYARHGYSFKFQPLRVFFDQQDWYIPVHTDIKSEFTDIEKENIKLLMKYEKNAAEYYDSFGRG
ncbi:MAG: YARHG domain-containing protein [Crocinitomicaceae bacterium]